MKQFLIVFLLFTLLACKRSHEDLSPSLTGTWLFTESSYGTGSSFIIQKADPVQVVSLSFQANHRFEVKGNATNSNIQALLSDFDRYQITIGDTLMFYQSAGLKTYKMLYTLDQTLTLSIPGCREGCENRFERQ